MQSHSKIIAKVGNYVITQDNLNDEKESSDFKGQGKTFSDKEVLEKLVEDKLLLIKAQELNISFSDEETKNMYKQMLMSMSSKKYSEGDENKLDSKHLQALKESFEIQKVREILGIDLDKTLEQLKNGTNIIYYK